jgi:hypothetical protein
MASRLDPKSRSKETSSRKTSQYTENSPGERFSSECLCAERIATFPRLTPGADARCVKPPGKSPFPLVLLLRSTLPPSSRQWQELQQGSRGTLHMERDSRLATPPCHDSRACGAEETNGAEWREPGKVYPPPPLQASDVGRGKRGNILARRMSAGCGPHDGRRGT